jgi:hypothetical protein
MTENNKVDKMLYPKNGTANVFHTDFPLTCSVHLILT